MGRKRVLHSSWDSSYTRDQIFTETGLDTGAKIPWASMLRGKDTKKLEGEFLTERSRSCQLRRCREREVLEGGKDGNSQEPTESGPEGLLRGRGGAGTGEIQPSRLLVTAVARSRERVYTHNLGPLSFSLLPRFGKTRRTGCSGASPGQTPWPAAPLLL